MKRLIAVLIAAAMLLPLTPVPAAQATCDAPKHAPKKVKHHHRHHKHHHQKGQDHHHLYLYDHKPLY
ncbi:hypothetical protein [Geomesophilobacter sediminis]|uniref:Uncharacterized protein n=1 Tax=Geomesophilobacter sediminis TaxID=2798584 RepID=A0A8J7JBW8_9BACT|nr:hypothetical protein [Geomesophilobacter sediminis]MBJ6724133.1 hypothetical protein [Geomesophilobacter sediminis]